MLSFWRFINLLVCWTFRRQQTWFTGLNVWCRHKLLHWILFRVSVHEELSSLVPWGWNSVCCGCYKPCRGKVRERVVGSRERNEGNAPGPEIKPHIHLSVHHGTLRIAPGSIHRMSKYKRRSSYYVCICPPCQIHPSGKVWMSQMVPCSFKRNTREISSLKKEWKQHMERCLGV